MLRRVERIYGFAVRAKDGDIGKVHDPYFLILLIAMIVLSSWLISNSVVH